MQTVEAIRKYLFRTPEGEVLSNYFDRIINPFTVEPHPKRHGEVDYEGIMGEVVIEGLEDHRIIAVCMISGRIMANPSCKLNLYYLDPDFVRTLSLKKLWDNIIPLASIHTIRSDNKVDIKVEPFIPYQTYDEKTKTWVDRFLPESQIAQPVVDFLNQNVNKVPQPYLVRSD